MYGVFNYGSSRFSPNPIYFPNLEISRGPTRSDQGAGTVLVAVGSKASPQFGHG
jgi:hypothetical protein